MRSSKGVKARLQHILDAIIEIENYSFDTDFFRIHEELYDEIRMYQAT